MDYYQLLFLFIFFGLFSYFLGYYLQNNKIKNLKKILLDHAILIAALIFILGLFGTNDSNLKQAAFTFSSVYFGFWLGNEQKRRDEIKTLKYYLGLIWGEQRFNLHQYEVMVQNYRFLFDNPDKIPLNAFKMGTIYSLSGALKVETHNAYISSGAVTTLTSVALPIAEKDDLFNTIEIAYSNVEHFKSFLMTVSIDFNSKAAMVGEIINSPFAQKAFDDMAAKVENVATELMIARRSAIKAKEDVDQFLNKLGVKQDTEEIREDTLTKEDKEFVSKVIRKVPISPDEVFKTPSSTKTEF